MPVISRTFSCAFAGLSIAGCAASRNPAQQSTTVSDLARQERPAGRAAVQYTVAFPTLSAHTAAVTARIPTTGRASLELMMPIWSPGYYKVENYADRVHDLSARTPSGAALVVEHAARNRWRIATRGATEIVVQYTVVADQQFVTADWVGDSLIVLNGAPTFATIADTIHRAIEVKLELPAGWRSATSLDTVPDGLRDHYRAADY